MHDQLFVILVAGLVLATTGACVWVRCWTVRRDAEVAEYFARQVAELSQPDAYRTY